MENLFNHIYNISGRSCGGCASAVKQKLSGVAGVTAVNIDLGKKQAEITSSQSVETARLQDSLKNSHYTISELQE